MEYPKDVRWGVKGWNVEKQDWDWLRDRTLSHEEAEAEAERYREDLGCDVAIAHPQIIVSRHPSAIEWLWEETGGFPDRDWIVLDGDVKAEDISGAVVVGTLPLHLAALCWEYWALEFTGTPPRGREYTVEEMDKAGAHLVQYEVRKIE